MAKGQTIGWGCAVLLLSLPWLGIVGCDHRHNEATPFDMMEKQAQATLSVRATLRMATSLPGVTAVAASKQNYLLYAYSLDDNGMNMPFVGPKGRRVAAWPVSVDSSTQVMDLRLAVPAKMLAKAGGHNVHFDLRSAAASDISGLVRSSRGAVGFDSNATVGGAMTLGGAHLTGLLGGANAHTTSAANAVELSPASTLAFDLLQTTAADHLAVEALTAFAQLSNLLMDEQPDVEASLDLSKAHSPSDYIAAVYLGLQHIILHRADLQLQVAHIVTAATQASSTSAGQSPQVAARLAGALASMGNNVVAAQRDPRHAAHRLLLPHAVAGAKLVKSGEPNATAVSVFAPSAIRFVDEDTSWAIGGAVEIGVPMVSTGITGYRVCLGGETAGATPWTVLGDALPASHPSLLVPAGTPVPAGATRIWVEPLAERTALAAYAWTPLQNVAVTPPVVQRALEGPMAPVASTVVDGAPVAVPSLTAVGGNHNVVLSWEPVALAESYRVYFADRPFAETSEALGSWPVADSPFVQGMIDANTTFWYRLCAVAGGHEITLSQLVQATTLSPPAAVGDLAASTIGAGIVLSWSASPSATRYALYRSENATVGDEDLLLSHAVPGMIDQQVVAGHTYRYFVRAIDDVSALSSEPSPVVQATYSG